MTHGWQLWLLNVENGSFYLGNIDMTYTWILDFTRNDSHKDDFLI